MECLGSGPPNAKLMAVAEAPGGEEERQGRPLVGQAGQEFDRMLAEAGIDRTAIRCDNLFHERPPSNKLKEYWCTNKATATEMYLGQRDALMEACPAYDWPNTYNWAPLYTGKYLLPEHLPALQRLKEDILKVGPNLVVALGGVPTWALLGKSGIKKQRGAIVESTLIPGLKVLPTWHPAFILRVWEQRLTGVADLMKARYECETPKIIRPKREVWTHPTLADLKLFYNKYIKDCPLLAFDTETAHGQITHISFAPSIDRSICIAFVDKTKPGYSYFQDPIEEASFWRWVIFVLESEIAKLAQNGLYDMQYLWIPHHTPVRNYIEDLMLLHHSLYTELEKGLGYLGSIHTNEAPWKLLRDRAKETVEKKDD